MNFKGGWTSVNSQESEESFPTHKSFREARAFTTDRLQELFEKATDEDFKNDIYSAIRIINQASYPFNYQIGEMQYWVAESFS